MSISMKVEAMAGDRIDDVCCEAINLASRVGIRVEFDFNSVKCIAMPGASPDDLARAYHQEASSNKPHKMAVAHPRGMEAQV